MMDKLLKEIKRCDICKAHLPSGPRPMVAASHASKIAIIGQAPGLKVHQTGISWDDPSGRKLREWMGVSDAAFYNEKQIALIPMGFCYPGKGKSGDLPPRPECAPQWHQALWDRMPEIQLILLIGQYAQKHYLDKERESNLTETVKNYKNYLPNYFVLPHPSPRNRFWLRKNPWFDEQVLPELKKRVKKTLK